MTFKEIDEMILDLENRTRKLKENLGNPQLTLQTQLEESLILLISGVEIMKHQHSLIYSLTHKKD